MRNVQETDAAQSTDEEDDVKPTVVEVELEITQYFCNNWSEKQNDTNVHASSLLQLVPLFCITHFLPVIQQ